MILLDTHVLAWAASDERKLGRKARALINKFWESGQVAISAISFWELALLQDRGRIALPAAPETWREQLLSAGLVEVPVNGAIGVRAVQLRGLPEDLADRFIVATALVHHATLVTADEKLLDWKHSLIRHDARA